MPAPQTEVLVSVAGSEHGRYLFGPGEYVIGRNAECQIPVDADLVSRKHAKLILNYDHALIEDLGSSNGTRVNEQPIAEVTRLWPNQKIQVGTATIELRRLKAEASDMSLAPSAAMVRRVLPEEFLREKKYDIGKIVAQGGMGAILNAKEATIERTVAMKVMIGSNSADDLLRFLNEAKITGQLEHPNIVPVHELSVDENGQPYYTMKMVRGITLKKVLDLMAEGVGATVKKYSLPALLTIFQKVCDALAFAHSRGVIHRDLKPENIMLGDFGEVLVMDWGLAKRAAVGEGASGRVGERGTAANSPSLLPLSPSMETLAGSIMGTPQFMAPEQARGEVGTLDARSDIYSLGAILYQILSLRVPVAGTDAWEVIGKVGRGEIEPLECGGKRSATPLWQERGDAAGEAQPDAPPRRGAPRPSENAAGAALCQRTPKRAIPESLAAVVRKAMALDRAARYATVAELQRDIEAYQNGFATGAENAGAWKQFTLFVKRNKAASIGVAAILVISIGFTAKVIHEGRRATVALTRLQGTAPTFAAQARALIEAQKFDDALNKIAFAIELDGNNADYHLFRANTLEATGHLSEAAESFRRVLILKSDDAAAKMNLELCERLLGENGGDGELTPPLKTKLLDALLAQKRQADAVPLSRELKRDNDIAETLIKTRLKAIMAQPGWKADKLRRLADGTFNLELSWAKISDLSILDGLPISQLDAGGPDQIDIEPLRKVPLTGLSLGNRPLTDITALKGMRLRNLTLSGTKVADLSPLVGMPVQSLWMNGSRVSDLTPLRGLPLKSLDANVTGIRDLRPLRDSPLETIMINDCRNVTSLAGLEKLPLHTLSIFRTSVEDLSPLRGSPVKELCLNQCDRIRDLTPLMDCKQLEDLIVPTHISDIAFLKSHPSLRRLSNQSIESFDGKASRIPTVAEFWKKNGERLARQVPMEKQLEKFRQRLIAQGNDPEKIPRWSFDAEGQLKITMINLKCSDLSDLRGVAITEFECRNADIHNLSPLEGAPLRLLRIEDAPVTDLSPIRAARLQVFIMHRTHVSDVSVLRGMPLTTVHIDNLPVDDVALLAEIPTIEQVMLPKGAKNVELLRHLPRLEFISYTWDTARSRPRQTAAEFWKEFDAKKAAGK